MVNIKIWKLKRVITKFYKNYSKEKKKPLSINLPTRVDMTRFVILTKNGGCAVGNNGKIRRWMRIKAGYKPTN